MTHLLRVAPQAPRPSFAPNYPGGRFSLVPVDIIEASMRLGVLSRHVAALSFLASLAYLVAIVDAGVLEFDLLFPRNETYTPTPFMPVVFGVRNAKLAQHLQARISVRIDNATDLGAPGETYSRSLARANVSSAEPYFEYSFIHDTFATDGRWRITWYVRYRSCLEDENGSHRGKTTYNETTAGVSFFTMRNDGRPIDLVAITANDKTCPKEQGVTIDVTDATVKVADPMGDPGTPDLYTCAVVAASTPTPTPSPCLIKIDSAAAASISTSLWLQRCNDWLESDDPDDCPPGSPFGPPKNSGQQLAVVGVACLTAAMGALGFFLL